MYGQKDVYMNINILIFEWLGYKCWTALEAKLFVKNTSSSVTFSWQHLKGFIGAFCLVDGFFASPALKFELHVSITDLGMNIKIKILNSGKIDIYTFQILKVTP